MPVPIGPLTYPINRPYPWTFFTPLVVVGALVVLAVLVPLNVAVSGYETIVTANKDFQLSPNHWWNKFSPRPPPGSLCDPLNLNQGDSFMTSYGVFDWKIITPNWKDTSATSFPYKGANLDGCSVETLGISANLMGMSVGLSASVFCDNETFPVTMRTTWSPWGTTNDLDSRSPNLNDTAPNGAIGGSTGVGLVLWAASYDLWQSLLNSVNSNSNAPTAFSLTISPSTDCAKTDYATGAYGCLQNDVYVKDTFVNGTLDMSLQMVNGKYNSDLQDLSGLGNQLAINNTLQALLAAVRLDLGNVFPNNVLTNTSLFTDVFGSDRSTSLYYMFYTPDTLELPLSSDNTTTLDATFQCKTQNPKTHLQTFVAVVVATFATFSTGWAVAMLIAAYFARKVPESNACIAHRLAVDHPNEPGAGGSAQRNLGYNEKMKEDTSD